MKKYLINGCLMVSLLSSGGVQAQEGAKYRDPYIVTQQIHKQPVAKTACIEFLRRPSQSQGIFAGLVVSAQEIDLDMLYDEIVQVITEHDALLDTIAELEVLQVKQAKSIESVAQACFEAYQTDPNFSEMDEDEQYQWVMADPSVLELTQEYEATSQAIDEATIQLAALEDRYQLLIYDYNQTQAETYRQYEGVTEEVESVVYPYSMPYVPVESIKLNPQETDLEKYLLDITRQLERVIPKLYCQLSFEDIYQQFLRYRQDESLSQIDDSKLVIQLEEGALEAYTYAKEFGLSELESLAHYAQRQFIKDQSDANYHQSYQTCLNIKESQWQFIQQVNHEAIDYLQTELANYLNHHKFTYDQVGAQIQNLNQHWQVKLVYWDEADHCWQANLTNNTGYLEEYQDKPLQTAIPATAARVVSRISKPQSLQTKDETKKDKLKPTDKEKDPQTSQPSRFDPDKVLQQLEKPEKKSDKAKSPTKTKENDPKKSDRKGSLKLPDTGEMRAKTVPVAIVLALSGGLLLWNRHLKRKQGQKHDTDFDLD